MLDGRLQANLTAWYYNYGGYQISSIIANTSVNTNIKAFLGGLGRRVPMASRTITGSST